jgi:hypothetical protein
MSAKHPNIRRLFSSNRAWAPRMRERDAECFLKLSGQQKPRYLWVGRPGLPPPPIPCLRSSPRSWS